MRAAKHLAARFHPVPDDLAPAVRACRRHHRNRAFEAIEYVGFAVLGNFECLVVIVSAQFAFGHKCLPQACFVSARNNRSRFVPKPISLPKPSLRGSVTPKKAGGSSSPLLDVRI